MLHKKDVNNIINKIKKIANPSRIYLFGSYAVGRPTKQSDLDLLVVDNSRKNKNKLALKISEKLFPRDYGLDLIVVSSEEIKKKQKMGLDFWLEILSKGKKVYDRE